MKYKIGVGTSDGINIDLHFGKLDSVYIFEVNEENGNSSFIEKRPVNLSSIASSGNSAVVTTGCSCGNGFVTAIAELVKDCTYFLVAKIGNRPYHLLQEYNINCIEAPFSIEESIKKVNSYFVLHKNRELHVF